MFSFSLLCLKLYVLEIKTLFLILLKIDLLSLEFLFLLSVPKFTLLLMVYILLFNLYFLCENNTLLLFLFNPGEEILGFGILYSFFNFIFI